MKKYASTADGNLYVRTTTWFGRKAERLVVAANLRAAQHQFGWTRDLHTSIHLRRATQKDYERLRDTLPIRG